MKLFWIIVGVIVAVILFIIFNGNNSSSSVSSDKIASTTYYSLLGILLCSGLLGTRIPMKHALRSAVIWLIIFLVLMLGYTNRYELQELGHQLTAGLIPGSPLSRQNDESTTVKLERMNNSSHFETRAKVDGTPIHFLIDTGASTVVLSYEDAQSIGINVDELNFSIPVNTANGKTLNAQAMINEITIGKITRRNLPVLISKPEVLDGSLLGMSFLNRLSAYSVRGNQMVLID